MNGRQLIDLLHGLDHAKLMDEAERLRSQADAIEAVAKRARLVQERRAEESAAAAKSCGANGVAVNEDMTTSIPYTNAQFRAVKLVFETCDCDGLKAASVAMGAGLTLDETMAVLTQSDRWFKCDSLGTWRMRKS